MFHFKNAGSNAPEGVIPLEYALIDTSQEPKDLERIRYVITITLHRAYSSYCKQECYRFATSKAEIQVRIVGRSSSLCAQEVAYQPVDCVALEKQYASHEHSFPHQCWCPLIIGSALLSIL